MIGVCLGVTGMLGLTGTLALCEWTSSDGAIYLSTLLCTNVLTQALKKTPYGSIGRRDIDRFLFDAGRGVSEMACGFGCHNIFIINIHHMFMYR
jgi:hypothetical protein